jgi:DNA primase
LKIPEDVIEQIRSQVNIVDVVSQFVQLKQSGKNLFGLCPFHEERTPSFSVSEEKQIFHCFSCGRGGNVFKFIMELENLSFPESVKRVAQLENIDVDDRYFNDTEPGSQNSAANEKVKQLIDLHEQSVKLYHHILTNTKMGQPALDYLHNRGVTDEIIDTYQLGYAPGQRLLKPFFDQRKIDYQLLRKSGLFSEDQEGNLRDRFIDRVMYPIRTSSGQTIAFSGRLLTTNSDLPKYLNSPETEIFNKRKILFNLDLARSNIRSDQPAILFEGFMDVITAFQAGIKSGIASMGTSLTEQQIYDIKRITHHVIICYDGDTPGQKAIKRAIDAFGESSKLDIKIVTVPDGMDPDEFIRKKGGPAFQELIKHALAPIEFELNYLKKQYNLDSEVDQSHYITEAIKLISRLDSSISRDLYLNRLADEFSVDKQVLIQQLAPLTKRVPVHPSQHQTSYHQSVPVEHPTKHMTLVQRTEMQLLNRMLHNHDVWIKVRGVQGFAFVDEPFQMLYLLAEGYFSKFADYHVATFSNMITESSLQSLLVDIEMLELPEQSTDEEVDNYLTILMRRVPVETKLKKKLAELKQAAKIGDVDKQRQLTIEIVKLEQEKRMKQKV